MKFRRCGKEDAEDICRIEEASFTEPLKRETMEKLLSDSFVYGAYNEHVTAFLCFEKVLEEGQIISVAVAPEYRRMGLGKRLFEYVIDEGKKLGIEVFTLEVRCDNMPAVGLYKSLGFKEVGKRKNYYKNPVCDGILMDLNL